jgi:hypothetical protein
MRLKIATGLAALALGTAFASISALAAEQNAAPYYGRNINDGGPGSAQPATKSTARPLYDSVQTPSAEAPNGLTEQKQTPHVGRPMNDGGM